MRGTIFCLLLQEYTRRTQLQMQMFYPCPTRFNCFCIENKDVMVEYKFL